MVTKAEARQEIADACQIIAKAGLAEHFTGHVSYLVDEDTLLLPEHLHDDGRGIESIRPENVIEMDISGGLTYSDLYQSEDDEEPPDEIIIHTSLIRDRPEIKSVVHAHPLYATGLSIAGEDIQGTGADVALLGGKAPVCDIGPKLLYSQEDGEILVEDMKDAYAVTLRGHGAVTAGASVAESTSRMWLLERAAKLQVIAAQAGEVQPYPDGVSPEIYYGRSPEESHLDGIFQWLRHEHLSEPPV